MEIHLKSKVLALCLLSLILLITSFSYGENQEKAIIEQIKIEGNLQISTETISYYIASKPGDIYNEEVLITDFKSLWATGFFDDLKIMVDEGEKGKIITFVVTEKKLIQEIEYKGNKSLKEADIQEKLDELYITLKPGSYLDMNTVYRVCKVIKDMLAEKGLKFAEVSPQIEEITSTTANIIINIDEGKKAKIGKIIFEGNKVFSNWHLLNVIKNTRPHWIFSWLSSHDLYKDEKFKEDLDKIIELYREKGYMGVKLEEPKIEVKRELSSLLHRPITRIHITIPIEEGEQYRVGEIGCEGNEVFKNEQILGVLGIKKGEIWDQKKFKKGYEFLQEAYGNRGYIMVLIAPNLKFDEEQKIINLNLKIEENDIYRIGRVEFHGNNVTRDKVIRRQMVINEGDVFSLQRLKMSMDLIKQLGYFDNIEPKQNIDHEAKKINLDLELHETGRNSVQFGGGYSAIEGMFANFSFETRNFFGKGQTFSIGGQLGRRAQMFQLSFYDPWFMDRHIGVGVNAYKRYIRYLDFIQGGMGGGVRFSWPFNRFNYGFLNYNYEIVEIQNPEEEDPLYSMFFLNRTLFPEGKTRVSSLTYSYVRNTIDHPIMPTRGSRTNVSTEFAGGPLGGDFKFIKLKIEESKHTPITARQIFSFRAELAHAFPMAGQELPIFERYFIGGEYTIRGLELRSVGPRNEQGFIIGGHKYLLLNLEYVFILNPQLRLVFFHDLGNAFAKEESYSLRNLRRTVGVEFRFFVPFLSMPFRLIWGVNLDPLEREPRSNFHFTVGTFF